MPPQPAPNALTAVRFVATDALRPLAWTSTLPAFDGAGVHQLFERRALVLLPGLEYTGHWRALPLSPHIQFGREATLTASECFGFRSPFVAPAAG